MVSSAAKQVRGHHCIESEGPSSYQVPDLDIRGKAFGNLIQANVATGAFVFFLAQLGQQSPASA